MSKVEWIHYILCYKIGGTTRGYCDVAQPPVFTNILLLAFTAFEMLADENKAFRIPFF